MASATKFYNAVNALTHKKVNLGTDTLKVALCNTAPVVTNSVLADLTQIGAGNGYSSGGSAVTTTSCNNTTGTDKLILVDLVFTASGGSIGPFRYVVLYSDTAASKDLLLFWDYGSSITLQDGETFTIDFDAATGVLTVA